MEVPSPQQAARPAPAPSASAALFREIHKNAWLKRLPPLAGDAAKLLAVGQKKNSCERWWIVFCVHDDASAYLEAYNDAAHATTHVPKWRSALGNALHVTGSIRPLGRGEYEFVVALREEAVRLVAPSREVMQDWVDTLRNKLREMKILSPRENVYSKPPEQIKPRAPTRDPNSPLPAPPPGPVVRVPGIEEPPRISDVAPDAVLPVDSARMNDDAIIDNSPSVPNSDSVVSSSSSDVNSTQGNRNLVNDQVRISSSKKSRIQLTPVDSGNTAVENVASTSSNAEIGEASGIQINNRNIVNEAVRISSSKKSKIQLTAVDNIGDAASSGNETSEPSGMSMNRSQVNEPVRISSSKKSKIHLSSMDKNARQANVDSDASRLHVQHDESNAWLDENVTIVNNDLIDVSTRDESLLTEADNFNVVLNVASKNDEKLIDLDFDGVAGSKDSFNMGNLDDFLTSQVGSQNDDNMWISEETVGPSSSGVTSYNKKKKKKSNTAQVSGMNVCLVKSVLMERYLDSDGFDDDDGNGCEDIGNTVEVVQGEVVKAKYSQVNLKEKHANKENRLLSKMETNKSTPLTTKQQNAVKPNAAVDQSNAAESESVLPKTAKAAKPAILPRTVMNVRCDDSGNIDKAILKPMVVERKKILLNRTSSVPDAVGTEELLQSYSGQMVEDSTGSQAQPSSNVTIITLTEPHTAIPLLDMNVFNFDSAKGFEPGHGRSISDTKSEDLVSKSGEISLQEDLNKLKNRLFPSNNSKSIVKSDYETCFTTVDSKKMNIKDNIISKRNSEGSVPITVSNAASYVNVTTGESDTNVFVSGNNSVMFDGDVSNSDVIVLRNAPCRKFEAISNVSMSVGSSYGHIRHSTTVETKPDDNTCDLNQNISNTAVKKISLDRNIESFEENATVLDRAVEHMSKADKVTVLNGVTLRKNDINSPSSSNVMPKLTEIDLIKMSDDLNKFRRKSESQISTVNVPERNVTVKLNMASEKRPRDDLYESVFTPFSVISKDNNVIMTSSKVNIGRMHENITNIESGVLESNSHVSEVNIGGIVANSDNIGDNLAQNNATRTENGDYEYLSWVRTDNNVSRTNKQIQSRSKKDGVKKTNESNMEANNSQKSNIFTRGLTELSLVSRFKNNFIIGSQNSANRNANNPSSQFYIDQSEQGTSSSVVASNLNNNINHGRGPEKKNGVFGGRLNAIFGRLNQDGVSKGCGVKEAGSRVESSSLRRNWSEHNDRTAPVPILRTKPIRPRPPLLEGQTSSANQSLSQERDGDSRQMRRRSSSLSSARCSIDEGVNSSSGSGIESPLSPNALNNSTGIISPDASLNHGSQSAQQRPLSLRSQQVCRLRREMTHSAGVRLRLRARDCPGEAVALVDAYGAVWVAGWKQRSHPLLYNALHIGDRLAAVGGLPVSCARQARKALGDTVNGAQFVELIIKRLPHGRVYALRKDADVQDLGLILDSATVVGIIPNSPASKSMVPSGGTLTEVNGRPLNLLLKKGDSQVKDRLNSIGKDVSILLQPTEFVSLLRTALKAVRGHKDYIVQ